MTRSQQKRVVRKHYGLAREITDAELDDEIYSLRRKLSLGTLDDHAEWLAIKLGLDAQRGAK